MVDIELFHLRHWEWTPATYDFTDMHLRLDIFEWLNTNGINYFLKKTYDHFYIMFPEDNDAVLFKLRWG